jgi:hypothetical protein
MGRWKNSSNPVAFAIDGSDLMVGGGSEKIYNCKKSAWMRDNDLKQLLAVRRTSEVVPWEHGLSWLRGESMAHRRD